MNETETFNNRPLVFGIYPGGMSGGENGLLLGVPDELESAGAALIELQGDISLFTVRCYDSFQDPGSPLGNAPSAPKAFVRYATPGNRAMDLVLQYRSASGNVSGYLDFVRHRIGRYAHLLYSVQITEEGNFADGAPVIDGSYPNVCAALTEGVQAAKSCLRELGRPDVRVGFNCTPTFGPAADFWTRIATRGDRFVEAVDYVGLDFGIWEMMRGVWLPSAGIPEGMPIHITEHGWPTSWGRSADRQAEVIEQVIRTAHANRERLNIDGYSLFALRDVALPAPENEHDLFSFFGIMTADYERKPAFETLRRLIQELGRDSRVHPTARRPE